MLEIEDIEGLIAACTVAIGQIDIAGLRERLAIPCPVIPVGLSLILEGLDGSWMAAVLEIALRHRLDIGMHRLRHQIGIFDAALGKAMRIESRIIAALCAHACIRCCIFLD